MEHDKPQINPYLFERQFEAFKTFIKDKSGIDFVSFASNPYMDDEEGYKYKIHREARDALAFQAWKPSDIGNGDIAEAVIEAIQTPKNNLVLWQPKYGEQARPHQPLFEARKQSDLMFRVEKCLFKLYRENENESSFSELVGIFGKTYSLLGYLMFLKDRSKYLPIKPKFFDQVFEYLGVNFKTTGKCSWDNYLTYVALIGEIKTLLTESLAVEVTLLDAHSFAWMLAGQMKRENRLADVQNYLSLPIKEREAIVKARVGQGQFRQSLIKHWSQCAVTACSEIPLLRASHIKPWSKSSLTECLSLHNGLLLSPNFDACFDSGYISFDDDGKIKISKQLTSDNAMALGIDEAKHLCFEKMESGHLQYLAYHRKYIFLDEH